MTALLAFLMMAQAESIKECRELSAEIQRAYASEMGETSQEIAQTVNGLKTTCESRFAKKGRSK